MTDPASHHTPAASARYFAVQRILEQIDDEVPRRSEIYAIVPSARDEAFACDRWTNSGVSLTTRDNSAVFFLSPTGDGVRDPRCRCTR